MSNRIPPHHRRRQLLAGLILAPLAVAAASSGSTAGPLLADPAQTTPGVAAATGGTSFQDRSWGDDTTGEALKASLTSGRWEAKHDLGSLYSAAKRTGADYAWSTKVGSDVNVTGRGVDIALIDTGVAPVAGLADPSRVINGPDLSFESQDGDTRYLDGYGHGTHMAGIIAGRDADVVPGREDDSTKFVGMAPNARILNVKVATADGGADVTQVIAAINWVVAHRNDAGLNVRVINLSYGTNSTQSYLLDPLAYAVENAWDKGIVVVAAAGNDGSGTRLTMPAADPHVLAVGAVDHVGTSADNDDDTATITNSGTDGRRADLVAPGKSVVSLRTPGSYADRHHPEGLVSGDAAQRFFRGTGTSQATATVSGAVALLLQQRPELTPDQVKYLLVSNANLLKNAGPTQGAGVLDIKRALQAATPGASLAAQTWPKATGLGTLEASRGGSHVLDPLDGTVLTGEVDAMGQRWDARSWRDATAAGTAWSGGQWLGRTWTGSDWSGTSWSARSWRDAAWTGDSWTNITWEARSWRSDLQARSWRDLWTSTGWTSIDVNRSWSEASWNARSWRARSWRQEW